MVLGARAIFEGRWQGGDESRDGGIGNGGGVDHVVGYLGGGGGGWDHRFGGSPIIDSGIDARIFTGQLIEPEIALSHRAGTDEEGSCEKRFGVHSERNVTK